MEKSHFSWTSFWGAGQGVKERVEVIVDGRLDPVISQTWNEHVEEFIPARISHLFCFDREKIESLADFESSAEVLTTAIRSVLGLDLVDRLAGDLLVLERRKRVALKSSTDQADIKAAQETIDQLDQEHGEILPVRGKTQNDLDLKKKRLRGVELVFEQEGGRSYEKRGSLETERRSILEQIRQSEDELRELADGAAPILIVKNLLSAVADQDRREEQATQSEVLNRVLDQRDAQILEVARASGMSERSAKAVSRFMNEDRNRRTLESKHNCYLHLDSDTRESIRLLQSLALHVLHDVQGRIRRRQRPPLAFPPHVFLLGYRPRKRGRESAGFPRHWCERLRGTPDAVRGGRATVVRRNGISRRPCCGASSLAPIRLPDLCGRGGLVRPLVNRSLVDDEITDH